MRDLDNQDDLCEAGEEKKALRLLSKVKRQERLSSCPIPLAAAATRAGLLNRNFIEVYD